MKILGNNQLYMDCPICGKRHHVHIITREEEIEINGKKERCAQRVHICKMDNLKEDEFITEEDKKYNKRVVDAIKKGEKLTEEKEKEEEEKGQLPTTEVAGL